MSEPEEIPPKRRHYRNACILGMIVIFLVLYVLSIGPAIEIVHRYPTLRPVAEVTYAPLQWLHDNTSLGPPLDRYRHWWRPWELSDEDHPEKWAS